MKNPIQQRIHAEAVIRIAQQLLGMKHFSAVALLMVAVFFLGAGWLPDGVTNLFLPNGDRQAGLFQLGGATLVFVSFGILVRQKLKEVHRVKVVAAIPPSARVLIIFLSTVRQDVLTAIEQNQPSCLLGNSWEMPYLAINHHAERLEELYVFTSPGDNGSHRQFGHFTRAISSLFSSLKIHELTGEGIDFEDVAAIHECLDKLYEQLDHRGIYGEHDVILDITGGQKTNSIAGAMATLAEGRKFQYVSTVNKQKVQCYDLVVEKM